MYGCFVCTYVNVPFVQCLRRPEQGIIAHLGKEVTVTVSCHRGSLVFLSKVGSTVTHWAVSSLPHKALQDTHRVCRWAHPWQEVGEGCLDSKATLLSECAPNTATTWCYISGLFSPLLGGHPNSWDALGFTDSQHILSLPLPTTDHISPLTALL